MTRWCLTSLCIICIALFSACTNEVDIAEKAHEAREENNYKNIYDLLIDYPALESFFTYGDLDKTTFEHELFHDVLGDQDYADTIVSLVDTLPPLFEPIKRHTTDLSGKESDGIDAKAPLPGLISNMAILTQNSVTLPLDQKNPIYNYLDGLNNSGNMIEMRRGDGSRGTMTYIRDLVADIVNQLADIDEHYVDAFMDILVMEMNAMRDPQNNEIDFADIDELLNEIAENQESKQGLIKMALGIKEICYNPDTQAALKNLLHSVGDFLGNPETKELISQLIQDLYNEYGQDTRFGELLDRAWTRGDPIGPWVEKMGIEGYGKEGKKQMTLRKLLLLPNVLNAIVEWISTMDQLGYSVDTVDDWLMNMANNDPFLHNRIEDNAAGGFGPLGKEFYQPTDHISFKNYSSLRGILQWARRASVPMSVTAPFLWESEPHSLLDSETAVSMIRALIPTIDDIPITCFLWFDMYEKGDGYEMGHGRPVTEMPKDGYGVMENGIYQAPLMSAVLNTSTMIALLVGDCLINGPYDNIHDNMGWLLYGRQFYFRIDLMQLLPRVAIVGPGLTEMLKMITGKNSLPILLWQGKAQEFIYLTISQLINDISNNLSAELTKKKVSQPVADYITFIIKSILPLGYPGEDPSNLFLLPKEWRDMWPSVQTLVSHYDPDAFHVDRFINENHPKHHLFYDTSHYSYRDENGNINDTINPFLSVIGAVCIACNQEYKKVVDRYPLTLDAVGQRQTAAKETFGGIIYPIDAIMSIISVLTEYDSETPEYSLSDQDHTLLRAVEPLLGQESFGVIDSIMDFICLLGKNEMKNARWHLLEGLAQVVSTTDEGIMPLGDGDVLPKPYTLGSALIRLAAKVNNDIDYKDFLETAVDTGGKILSPGNSTVASLVGMMALFTGVDIPDENFVRALEGILQVLEESTKDRLVSESLVDLSIILDQLNNAHVWGGTLNLAKDTLAPDGLITYIILGLQKDPNYSWDDILNDTSNFLNSDLMMSYDEGSFWKDIYYLVNFMANVF